MLDKLTINITIQIEDILKNNTLTGLQKSLMFYIEYNKNNLKINGNNYIDTQEKLISLVSKDFRESFDDILNNYIVLVHKGYIKEFLKINEDF